MSLHYYYAAGIQIIPNNNHRKTDSKTATLLCHSFLFINPNLKRNNIPNTIKTNNKLVTKPSGIKSGDTRTCPLKTDINGEKRDKKKMNNILSAISITSTTFLLEISIHRT